VETTIVNKLIQYPHSNIVKYYDITDTHVDMEQVNTVKSNPSLLDEPKRMTSQKIIEIQETMKNIILLKKVIK
jgi:hypothetical protein